MKVLDLVSGGISKGIRYFKVNSASIMAGAACGTAMIAVYKAGRCAIKAHEAVEGLKSESEEHIDTLDKVKIAVPYFIEPAIFTFLTLSLILGSNHVHLRRNAAWASMYAISANDLRAYREKLEEKLTKTKAEEAKHEIAESKLNKIMPISEDRVYSTKNGDYLFYDAFTGITFRSNMQTVESAVNVFNDNVLGEFQTPMEYFYDNLGVHFPVDIPPVLKNAGFVYNTTGVMEPEYTTVQMPSGEPAVVMTYYPTALYDDLHMQ